MTSDLGASSLPTIDMPPRSFSPSRPSRLFLGARCERSRARAACDRRQIGRCANHASSYSTRADCGDRRSTSPPPRRPGTASAVELVVARARTRVAERYRSQRIARFRRAKWNSGKSGERLLVALAGPPRSGPAPALHDPQLVERDGVLAAFSARARRQALGARSSSSTCRVGDAQVDVGGREHAAPPRSPLAAGRCHARTAPSSISWRTASSKSERRPPPLTRTSWVMAKPWRSYASTSAASSVCGPTSTGRARQRAPQAQRCARADQSRAMEMRRCRRSTSFSRLPPHRLRASSGASPCGIRPPVAAGSPDRRPGSGAASSAPETRSGFRRAIAPSIEAIGPVAGTLELRVAPGHRTSRIDRELAQALRRSSRCRRPRRHQLEVLLVHLDRLLLERVGLLLEDDLVVLEGSAVRGRSLGARTRAASG